MKIDFFTTDSEILLAIIYAYKEENGASLETIIGTANFINRCYPSFEEVKGGMTRLLAAGLIVENKGHFDLSPQTADYYSKNSKPNSLVRKDLERMEKFLDSGDWSSEMDPGRATEIEAYLTKELFEEAIRKLQTPPKKKKRSGK